MKKLSVIIAICVAVCMLAACSEARTSETTEAQTTVKETVEETDTDPAEAAGEAGKTVIESEDIRVGGWSTPNDMTAKIDDESYAIFSKATEGLDGAVYEPVAVLGTQVVAGCNYAFLSLITPVTEGKVQPYAAVVTVYEALDGTASVTGEYTVDAAMFTASAEESDETGESQQADGQTDVDAPVMMTGGWTVNGSAADGASLSQDDADAFESATEGLTGAGYKPIAVIGTQVVAGQNRAYLCLKQLVVPDAEPELCVVIVYSDLSGGHTITNIADFNMAEIIG